MQTRRQLLQQAILAPLAAGLVSTRPVSGLEIISEPDCLSQESARGFSLLAAAASRFVVVCGAGATAISRAPELRGRALKGEWVVWESSPPNVMRGEFSALRKTMQDVFGIRLGEPIKPGLYIQYLRPRPTLTRSFLQAIPVICPDREVIAEHAGTPVAMKRRLGRGGIVYLGSMLGPNLHAEEPEARRIAIGLRQTTGFEIFGYTG